LSVPEGGPDEAVLTQVRELVLPQIERRGPIEAWIIDDTGFPKKGVHLSGWRGSIVGSWASTLSMLRSRNCLNPLAS